MALKLADRVWETTTSTGTGAITLAGALSGYRTFASQCATGDTIYYTIEGGGQWEVGLGTYTTATNSLTRTTVLDSSNANALVNFSAGIKNVYAVYPGDASGMRNLIGVQYTVTPRQYGAAGNGTTDDTVAIQAAIDAATALVGNSPTSGAFAEVNLEGLCYLVSDELVVSTGADNYIRFCNGRLLASSAGGVWAPDANGYSTKSLLKINNSVSRGVVEYVSFDCNNVTNGITKTDTAGGFWRIRCNDISKMDRWGIYLGSGAGDTRVELNAITEINNTDAAFPQVTITGNLTSASTTVSGISSTSALSVGQTVSGIGIPFDTTIVSKTSTSITLSKAATVTTTAASLGVTNFHAYGIWYNNADDKITSNTVRWCLCPLYMNGGGSTSLISNNHFYNGGSGTGGRIESRIIYLGSGSNSNIFTGNYLDNGIIELRGTDQCFFSNRIAYTSGANNQCVFLLVATSVNQVLSSFEVRDFELPPKVISGSPPLYKFTADSGANWAAGISDSLLPIEHTYKVLRARTEDEIVAADNFNAVKRFVSATDGAWTSWRDKNTASATEPGIGAKGQQLVAVSGTTVRGPVGLDTPYLIVASGQSNAIGTNSGSTGGDMTVNPNVKAWNGSAWVTATLGQAPFATSTSTRNNVNFQFAKAVQERRGGTVYLVLTGQGNTAISEWLGTGAQWTALNSAVAAALATPEMTLVGKTAANCFTWFQGENDFSNTGYKTDFLTLRTQAITAGWLQDYTPVIAGTIYSTANESRAQLQSLFEDPQQVWFALASNDGAPISADNTHYTGAGYELMGRKHFMAALMGLPRRAFDPSSVMQYGADGVMTLYPSKVTIQPYGIYLSTCGVRTFQSNNAKTLMESAITANTAWCLWNGNGQPPQIALGSSSGNLNGSRLDGYKARGGSTTSPSAPNANDEVLSIRGFAYDGTAAGAGAWNQIAGIRIEVAATVGVGDAPGRVVFSTTPDGTSLPVDRLVVEADGSFGFKSGVGNGASVVQTGTLKTAAPPAVNTPTGRVTTNTGAIAANSDVQFTLTNSCIGANDVLFVDHISGGTFGAYVVQARCAAGSATISIRNLTGASLGEALGLQFVLFKSATS